MKRKSKIWGPSSEEFRTIVDSCNSLTEILNYFGLCNNGNNYGTLHKRIEEEKIDIQHIYNSVKEANKNRLTNFNPAISLNEVLIKNSTYNRQDLKRRLLKENLLENKCALCGLPPIWNGMLLVLQLDHIDGIRNNNELSNLRLICPNCHTQTNTYANKKDHKDRYKYWTKKNTKCSNCDINISDDTKHGLCKNCLSLTQRKTDRPSLEVLLKDVEKLGYRGTGIKYNVSDNAIRKWIKKYNN